jgi:two-component system response regulator AtoC
VLPTRVAELVRPALRLPDMLAEYAPGEYEVLLASTQPEFAMAITANISAKLREAGLVGRTGLAIYPRDGRTPEELIAVSCARVRGVDDEPGSTVVVHDPVMERVYALAERAAAGTINVLIVGETGVGKEVMAERVHQLSPRLGKPFLCLNCASLSDNLLESELFGHERGAFTGATEAKAGLLETAPGGTVFLDEIGELPLNLQAKLLRVLETRQVTRVGGLKPRPIDVRFLAATNCNLETDVTAGRFRRDLYFRLNGITLQIPPLRMRRTEILPLARMFLDRFSKQVGRDTSPRIGMEAQSLLEAYVWPGNIRELRNAMERASLLCAGDEISPDHLPLESMIAASSLLTGFSAPMATQAFGDLANPTGVSIAPRPTQPMAVLATPQGVQGPPGVRAGQSVDTERDRILGVLAACGGNQSRAARELGIARSTLVLKLNSYQIVRPRKTT